MLIVITVLLKVATRNRNRLKIIGCSHNRNHNRLIILGRNHNRSRNYLNVIGPNPASQTKKRNTQVLCSLR